MEVDSDRSAAFLEDDLDLGLKILGETLNRGAGMNIQIAPFLLAFCGRSRARCQRFEIPRRQPLLNGSFGDLDLPISRRDGEQGPSLSGSQPPLASASGAGSPQKSS